MGTFAGSVHFRTEDREAVLKAVHAAAKQRKLKCLVSPALSGWVAVYPEGNGQDLDFGDALAAKAKCDAVQVTVHDSDIFCYRYYRNGKLVDEYNSRPDYFGEPERPVEETRGRPELFADLVPGKVEELRRILDAADETIFAEEQLEEFASVLGLSNPAAAYEYFEEGETDGVEGWDQFEHVPKRRERNTEPMPAPFQLRPVQDDLLPEVRDRVAIIAQSQPHGTVMCVAGPTGWLVLELNPPTPSPLRRYPWLADAPPETLLQEPGTWCMTISPDRQFLAMAEQGSVVIRDARGGQERQRLKIGTNARVEDLAFSGDGGRLACVAPNSLAVWDLASGKRIYEGEGASLVRARFAPGGKELLIDESRRWRLVSLDSGKDLRAVYPGGRLQIWESTISDAQREATQMDPEALRKQMKSIEAAMTKVAARTGQSPEDAEAILRPMREQMEQRIKAITDGTLAQQIRDQMQNQALERALCMASDPDGRTLICGIQQGLRVYQWDHILKGPDELREPLYRWDPPVTIGALVAIDKSVHAIAPVPGKTAILFASANGVIRMMDLATGETEDILRLGDQILIKWIGPSPDGKRLGCLLNNQVSAMQTRNWGCDAFAVIQRKG